MAKTKAATAEVKDKGPGKGTSPAEVFKSIFTVNLGIKKSERAVVFTDLMHEGEEVSDDERKQRDALREIARAVAEEGRKLCTTDYIEFPSVMGHGKEPPAEVWETAFGPKAVAELVEKDILDRILLKEASKKELEEAEEVIKVLGKPPDAVVALSNYSTSHTRFRDFLTRCMRARYASMPLFDEGMITGAMTADWKQVARKTIRLAGLMNGADMAYVTSPNGTSISFSMKGREVKPDTGILTEPGAFGNLPAGEAYLAPLEGTAEGILILEWAPTGKLAEPVSLYVKGGRVVEVAGRGELASDLTKRIKENPLIGNIAELGVGTNDKATRPDNILETEKILGTVHMALGDNSSFGGEVSVPFHQDFIFFRPNLEVFKDGQKIELIIDGKPKF